jgi:malate dehydrogenase (oxaloacetate-decarboxylating)(NADP+)
MNQWKSAHAVDTEARSLAEAMRGADVVFGLSQKGTLTRDMIAPWPRTRIIFAMANPDPEITPEEVAAVRSDAIMATAGPTTPTRSTTFSASPTSSAARWTCAPPRSTTR